MALESKTHSFEKGWENLPITPCCAALSAMVWFTKGLFILEPPEFNYVLLNKYISFSNSSLDRFPKEWSAFCGSLILDTNSINHRIHTPIVIQIYSLCNFSFHLLCTRNLGYCITTWLLPFMVNCHIKGTLNIIEWQCHQYHWFYSKESFS